MLPNVKLSRRNFARLLFWLAGALGLGGLVRYFSHEPESGPPTSFDLGPVVDFQPNSKTVYLDIPAVLYYKEGEFRAYSLKCTHLGCTLVDADDRFSCPCHGSEFSSEGQVLKGPALENLPELNLEVSTKGSLILKTEGGIR